MSLLPFRTKTVQWSAGDVSIDGLGNLPANPLNVLETIYKPGNHVAYVGSSNCTINATSQFIRIFINCRLLSVVRYCSCIGTVLEANVQATSSRYCRCCGTQESGNNRCSSASGKCVTCFFVVVYPGKQNVYPNVPLTCNCIQCSGFCTDVVGVVLWL